ncbi:alpha/beta fold hydrolase [Streptomyces sp. NPDC059679]|uniref:alpha/beta fold hydrolase n=1 Tax=Streptomyces sp. NPDC059679 TaxID=3346903 RepID=UPI0036C3DCC3
MNRRNLVLLTIASATTAACSASTGVTPARTKVRRTVVTHGKVRIETISQGEGPTVVILPSLGRGAEDYDKVAPRVAAAGFRVLRPQPRGIGRSEGPMEDLDMHDFAADVAAVLDHEKAGPAVVVGHAWGSQPARMLAEDRPDLVSGLVMAAASAGKLPAGSKEKPYSRNREAIDGSGDLTLPEKQRLRYLKQAFFAPGHDPRPWLTGWYPKTHDAQAHARNVTPVDDYFAGGDVPMLDLQAEFDAVVVPNVFKPMLGDRVTVQVIKNAGHALAPEQPAAMSKAVVAFARRVHGTQTS